MTGGETASAALEAFIDEGIRRAKLHNYRPTVFQRMRHDHGTLQAIEMLVRSGDIQSGFKRLQELDLREWTIEAAVVKFPTEFSRVARECAEWRLKQAQ